MIAVFISSLKDVVYSSFPKMGDQVTTQVIMILVILEGWEEQGAY